MSEYTKQTIAIDCDDVIANINDAVRLFVNETYGLAHTPEEYRVTGEYKRYWERIWGVADHEHSDRFDHFVASGRMAHLEPIEGALEANAPRLFDDVTFMHLWDEGDTKATKAQICKELKATHLIDDNYDHCKLAAEAGVRALVFGDYGWNRDRPLMAGMQRVNSWHEVLDYFNG